MSPAKRVHDGLRLPDAPTSLTHEFAPVLRGRSPAYRCLQISLLECRIEAVSGYRPFGHGTRGYVLLGHLNYPQVNKRRLEGGMPLPTPSEGVLELLGRDAPIVLALVRADGVVSNPLQ